MSRIATSLAVRRCARHPRALLTFVLGLAVTAAFCALQATAVATVQNGIDARFTASFPTGACASSDLGSPDTACAPAESCGTPCPVTFTSQSTDTMGRGIAYESWQVSSFSAATPPATGAGHSFSYTASQPGGYAANLTVYTTDFRQAQAYFRFTIRPPTEPPADIALRHGSAVRLPATLELVTPKRNLSLGGTDGWQSGQPGSSSSAFGPATVVRHTGPDSAGLYHYFVRIDQAPLGPVYVYALAWNADQTFADSKAITFNVISNALPALRALSLVAMQQVVRKKAATQLTADAQIVATKPTVAHVLVRLERRPRPGRLTNVVTHSRGVWQYYRTIDKPFRIGSGKSVLYVPGYFPLKIEQILPLSCSNVGHMLDIGWQLRMVTQVRFGAQRKPLRRSTRSVVHCSAVRPPRGGHTS